MAAALHHSLDFDQRKTAKDISVCLATNASQILQPNVQFEEIDGFRSAVLEQRKEKDINLGFSNCDNDNNGMTENQVCKQESKVKSLPSLPQPVVTLYATTQVSLGWKENIPIGAGMYNLGNTCYMNSILQALFHVPAFVNWMLSDSHHNLKCEQNDGWGECLTCAMAKTLQFSHQKSGRVIKPYDIYNKLDLICVTMVAGQQEDAHEFLRCLLEGMERTYIHRYKAEKLDSFSKETTPINQIFGGYIRTEVRCNLCRHASISFQHFQDVLVDIDNINTLDEALANYFNCEELGHNDYNCEGCKRRVPATKQFSLERPPKVLCIQLKRFSIMGDKISRHIRFKQIVDMGPYLSREASDSAARKLNYKLVSIVSHEGASVNSGHYRAVAQTSSGQYYSFDDSSVRSTDMTNVLNTNAYIMIYEMEPSDHTKLPSPKPTKNNELITRIKPAINNSQHQNNKNENSIKPVKNCANPTTDGDINIKPVIDGAKPSISYAGKVRGISDSISDGTSRNGIIHLQSETNDRSLHCQVEQLNNDNNTLLQYKGSSEEELVTLIEISSVSPKYDDGKNNSSGEQDMWPTLPNREKTDARYGSTDGQYSKRINNIRKTNKSRNNSRRFRK